MYTTIPRWNLKHFGNLVITARPMDTRRPPRLICSLLFNSFSNSSSRGCSHFKRKKKINRKFVKPFRQVKLVALSDNYSLLSRLPITIIINNNNSKRKIFFFLKALRQPPCSSNGSTIQIDVDHPNIKYFLSPTPTLPSLVWDL